MVISQHVTRASSKPSTSTRSTSPSIPSISIVTCLLFLNLINLLIIPTIAITLLRPGDADSPVVELYGTKTVKQPKTDEYFVYLNVTFPKRFSPKTEYASDLPVVFASTHTRTDDQNDRSEDIPVLSATIIYVTPSYFQVLVACEYGYTFWRTEKTKVILDYYAYDKNLIDDIEEDNGGDTLHGSVLLSPQSVNPPTDGTSPFSRTTSIYFDKGFEYVPSVFGQIKYKQDGKTLSTKDEDPIPFLLVVSNIGLDFIEFSYLCTQRSYPPSPFASDVFPINNNCVWDNFLFVDWRAWPQNVTKEIQNKWGNETTTIVTDGGSPYHNLTYLPNVKFNSDNNNNNNNNNRRKTTNQLTREEEMMVGANNLDQIHLSLVDEDEAFSDSIFVFNKRTTNFQSPPGMIGMPYIAQSQLED